MPKTNASIHSTCIAAIRRKTVAPFGYPLTLLFETPDWMLSENGFVADVERVEDELSIAMTHVDNDNWTLLTTRRVISAMAGTVVKTFLRDVKNHRLGDFKGYGKTPTTLGTLALHDGSQVNFLIETGKASMIMIYGVRTALALAQGDANDSDKGSPLLR